MAKGKKDKLFRRRRRLAEDFTFGKQTAAVFDDMEGREAGPTWTRSDRRARLCN